jgi:hypothetical protein
MAADPPPPRIGQPTGGAPTIDSPSTPPDAAAALAFALQVLGIPADHAQIAHQAGKLPLDEGDILRAAKRFPAVV